MTTTMTQTTIVTREEFAQRREKVLAFLREQNTKLVIESGSEKVFSNDVHYPFRVDSDFYYLTGFTEPDAALVLDPQATHPYTIYLREKDPAKEIWDGPRLGITDACQVLGADQALDIKNFKSEKNKEQALKFVHSLRLIKSKAEVETISKALDVTIQAHRMVKETITSGIYEYEVEAMLNNVFRSSGANGWAYPAIVASGANSCILHYISNKEKIQAGDLVLIDAGCEFEYYASDITRTFAADGEYSQEQKDIIDLVVAAQEAAITTVMPGNSFEYTHEAATAVIAEGLQELGYIQDKNNEDEVKKFYMHGTGHPLGIDVHDCGVEDKQVKYVPGMVTTIEPGIYIPDKKIGVRIEDNVLVTAEDCEVLSASLDKF